MKRMTKNEHFHSEQIDKRKREHHSRIFGLERISEYVLENGPKSHEVIRIKKPKSL